MGFPWEKFPGYRHARTLGNVEGKGSAWRGEERVGRWYVFGVDGGDEVVEEDRGGKGKGKRKEESDDD
jgi:25S rRNA (uracil2634-N3)-methyltransferase